MKDLKSYWALLRTVSPRALGGAALRRGSRVAQERWYRRGRPPTEQELLKSHGAADEAGLIAAALLRSQPLPWCDSRCRPGVRRLLDARPEARARALARADRALGRELSVFGRTVSFGPRPIDWDLDLGCGERFLVGKPPPAGSDLKFPWVFGRLDTLIALGQGYWACEGQGKLDRRREYAREFVDSVSDFMRTHPAAAGVQWRSPMEVALRAVNLAQALHMFADAEELAAPGFFTGVLRWISEHLRFVEAHLEDAGAVPNNHLISGLVGLVVVGSLLPRIPGASRRAERAARRLRRELKAQVHPDGMSFEGSVPYHRLSLELFLLAALVAPSGGIDLGAEYLDLLRAMFRCSVGYVTAAGRAPQIGDNDSGRVLALTDRESLDHSYLAPLGAAFFGDPSLKVRAPHPASALPDEALWLLGERGVERFEPLAAAAERGDWWSTAGGLYLLRNGDWEVAVSAGRQGQRGVGGHSHNDKLSFELHLGGKPVVVDPGSPTYTREPSVRNRYRSTAMHNTPQVDGEEQAPIDPQRLFALPEGAYAQVSALSEGRLLTSHRGYRRLPGQVSVHRMFDLGNLSSRPHRGLVIDDHFEGRGVHSLSWGIHFAPGSLTVDSTAVSFEGRDGAVVRLELPPQLQVEAGTYGYSPGYGELIEAPKLTLRWRGALPASFTQRWSQT